MYEDKVYVGYAQNRAIRYQATSGGVGSAILKYLFVRGVIKSAISFDYNKDSVKYTPRVITNFNEYKISGSIYHSIDLIRYIRANINNIQSPFFCFALPCQVKSIRSILNRNNIESYIVELVCSSQQTFEATEYLLKSLRIDISEVNSIKYRGNGWPSGVQIIKKCGEEIFVPNNNSIWAKIFHSRLFVLPQCFLCNPDRKTEADLTIADPWGIDKIADEQNIGRTLFYVRSAQMSEVISSMITDKILIIENIENSVFRDSQKGTIHKKQAMLKHKKAAKAIKALYTNERYRKIVLSNSLLFRLHIIVNSNLNKILIKSN